MYSVIRILLFLLFTLFHIKLTITVYVPSTSNGGYIYNLPSSPFDHYNQFPYPLPLKSQFIPSIHLPSSHSAHSLNINLPPPFLHNFLNHEDEIYYAHDGRALKQYEVMERIIGDLEHPDGFLGSSPLLLDSLLSKFSAQVNNGYYDYLGNGLSPVTKNHGPVALGSGGLGYIRLSNGAAYLGSGSLGYISGQQANQAIIDAKTRKGLTPPGPLHFGHGF